LKYLRFCRAVRALLRKAPVLLSCAFLVAACHRSSDKILVRPEDPARYGDDPSVNASHFSDYTVLGISARPKNPGHFDIALSGKSGILQLRDIDLRPFVPRVPLIARGNELLTEIALEQREYNRFDTSLPPQTGGIVPHLANNCLNAGLWELYLTKPEEGGIQRKFYHSWFEFPSDFYRSLFRQETGLDYSSYSSLLDHYQKLEGLSVDLSYLRTVRSATEIPPQMIDTHQSEPVLRLPEQQRKLKLVVTKDIRTYGDFAAPARQPIKFAWFRPPGIYSTAKPVKADLSFLGRVADAKWRRVSETRLAQEHDELEIDFERGTNWKLALRWPFVRITHGLRLVLGGIDLDRLPMIRSEQPRDSELGRVTFGIGTPEVYASYSFRLAEFEQEPSTYLLLLDRDGKYVDNHTTGLDRVYIGRRSDGRIELYLVAYEREAIVAHFTIPARPSGRAY
jgi:hypothetical protein